MFITFPRFQLDDSHGFPAAEFDVVSGSLQASFDLIPAGTNVSHAVVLQPKISGAHNFIPAMVNYKNSNGDELVRKGCLQSLTDKKFQR